MDTNVKGPKGAAGEFVKESAGQGFRFVHLDRPKALHAINLPMVQKIQQKLNRWAELDVVDVVILRSTGDRAFCAGGDIAQLWKDAKDPETRSKALEFFKQEYALNFALGSYPKPVIAMIKGITMGGGVGLSIHGSIRVACDSTVFAMPETSIGFFPDVGGGYFLPRLDEWAQVGRGAGHDALGMYVGLTGERIRGADNYWLGIATHYLEQKMIDDIEHDLSTIFVSPRYAGNPVDLNRHLHEYLSDNRDLTIAKCSLPIDLIYECFDRAASVSEIQDRLSAKIESSIDDKSPETVWAKRALDQLKTASPTSLKVTFKLIKEGRKLDFAANFAREFRIASRMMESSHDFFEGVDAKVISKHNQPKWNPATLEEVSDAAVEAYFAPMEDADAEMPRLVLPDRARLEKSTDTTSKMKIAAQSRGQKPRSQM